MTPRALMALFDDFAGPSWDGWREILDDVTEDTREVWAICGRGAGKSRVAALIGVSYAVRRYKLVAGEQVFVQVIAPDRKQAAITFKYICGLIKSRPELARLIAAEKSESVELTNGVVVEVGTATTAAPRGRSYACVIVEEAAFLRSDDSANPDTEVLRAVRPGLARVPGSVLVVISSPYARKGELWKAHERYSKGTPPHVVYLQRPTLELNPSFDRAEVERALVEDPAGAAAEYLAQFRRDIESFISIESVRACVVPGRRELLPVAPMKIDGQTIGHEYKGFVDPSGGVGDSFTVAVGHAEPGRGGTVAVIDATREIRAPFSPDVATKEVAGLLLSYGLTKVTGDRYAGEWPREAFLKQGIRYEASAHPKSDIYRDCLPLINSGRVELLDDERIVAQLVGLERRTARGGRDSIDHAPGGHDDVVNAVCGVATLLVSHAKPQVSAVWGRRDGRPAAASVQTLTPGQMIRARTAWGQGLAPDDVFNRGTQQTASTAGRNAR